MRNVILRLLSPLALALPLGLSSILPALAQPIDVPGTAAAGPAVGTPGGALNGEYWKRPPVSILTDGRANRANGIDKQIETFGPPQGVFKATLFNYTGNDLSLIKAWLSSDGDSFVGTTNNLDDGAVRFTGYINVATPGIIKLGVTSDDGSRITIADMDIAERDGSHGDETQDVDVNFLEAGLYPIEITYFNGDWTSDGNNHSGNPDASVHGGANFHLRVGGADVNSTTAGIFHQTGLTVVQVLSITNSSWKFTNCAAVGAPPEAVPLLSAIGYDDSLWGQGMGLFGTEPDIGQYAPYTIGTPIPQVGGATIYFRTTFNWAGGDPSAFVLSTTNYIDDACVWYLNGTEVARLRVADSSACDTFGSNPPTEGAPDVINYPSGVLRNGTNVLVAELHQSSAGSSDMIFGMSLTATPSIPATITDSTQPSNRVVSAFRRSDLSVIAIGLPAPSYQWFKDGVAIDPAVNATATRSVYVISNMVAGDAGSYFCRVANNLATVDSRIAQVTFSADNEGPVVAGASGSGSFDKITLAFNELIDPATAGDVFNYTVDGGVAVSGAIMNADGMSVTLTTSPQAENTLYTVTVANISDLSGNAIAAPNNTGTFRSWVTGPGGGVLFESWLGIAGNTIASLTSSPNYPNNPSLAAQIPQFDSRYVYPDNAVEAYGARMQALFIPPASGNWVFYIRSDDAGQLFVNTNGANAAGATLVALENGCCNAWLPVGAAQTSRPIPMQAGQGYYVMALYKEGTGGDWCKVAAALESAGTPPSQGDGVIDPLSLGFSEVGYPAAPAGIGGPLTITQQPVSQSVSANATVTFTARGANPNGLPIFYQWSENGVEIAGATGPNYVIPQAPLSANGHTFRCRIAVVGTSINSQEATLGVTEDTIAPRALSASGSVNFSNIVVQFSELVEPGSAQDPFNYTVAGRAVVNATLQSGGQSVLVQVDPALAPDTAYQITVQNVTDLAGNALSPSPTTLSFRSYAISCGFALEQLYFNIPGVTVADLTGNPNYPNNPGLQTYVGLLAGPTDTYDNYGTRLTGVLIPPVSGAYNFFMSSDDGGAFYLSTDASPGNAVLICSEPTWNGSRDWVGTARRNAAAPENRSSTLFPAGIMLTAGQHYYFELLAKEGGGGDNCGATWQLPGAPLPANGSPPIAGIYMGAPANPVGASLAITQQPVDDSVVASDAFQTASFTVGVSASTQGNTNPPTFYQWYRRSGTNNFSPISGGNSATLTFPVTLSDNGAQFRAQVYIPGATATSQVARLTVTGGEQPNTPPRFTCNTNIPAVPENSGPQTVPGVATDILPGSITILYGSDFVTQPPASTLYGIAAVADGKLKLTTAINSAYGVFYSPALAGLTESYVVTFSSYIGGGTCCGDPTTGNPTSTADGFSVNVANDLPMPPAYGNPGEDGAGNGLTVQFDTWDNGGGEAPAIEVEYGQVSLARVPMVPHLSQGAGVPRYIPTRIVVHANGTADVDYDGTNVVSGVVLPGYAPTAGLQLGFGARTGGANDNHWIDDLLVQATVAGSPPGESGQTVTFITSNNNPSLFSVQPAVSPTGTLTYTPAPGACGQAIVTLVAKDNGGTANGGSDTSAPCTLVINVTCQNNCPVASAQSVTVTAGASVPIVLTATDADGDALTYTVVTGPTHGALSGTAPNLTYTPTAGYTGADSFVFKASDGDTNCNSTATVSITVRPSTGNQCPVARPVLITVDSGVPVGIALQVVVSDPDNDPLTVMIVTGPQHGSLTQPTPETPCYFYTSDPGYCGPDSFTFKANDGQCDSNLGTVSISVVCTGSNTPPIARITGYPLADFSPNLTNPVLISCNGSFACMELSGATSSDRETPNSGLKFRWFLDPYPLPISTSMIFSNFCIEICTPTIVLTVVDPQDEVGIDTLTIDVITASDAIDELISKVHSSNIARKWKRPFIQTLKFAAGLTGRGIDPDWESGGCSCACWRIHLAAEALSFFQFKVWSLISEDNPEEAACWILWSQDIIDALEQCEECQMDDGWDDDDEWVDPDDFGRPSVG